jgi:hypothetical protein
MVEADVRRAGPVQEEAAHLLLHFRAAHVDVHLLGLAEELHHARKDAGTGSNLPGHEASLCGQLSHVPRCGAHSAGIE